jgi:hypothetical protein
MNGAVSTKPRRINPGTPKPWIHFHNELDEATEARLIIVKAQPAKAVFLIHSALSKMAITADALAAPDNNFNNFNCSTSMVSVSP